MSGVVNKNFIKIKAKNLRTEKIEEMTEIFNRFQKRGFAVTAYAKAYGVGHAIVSQVLDGAFIGSKNNKSGPTRKIIAQLKVDGVWIGSLPWEN
ncbi:hypothetical protein [Halarcobacter sp.]|uniref:hypothetical protein n=1 Tax=Halarcobacter sp. TaxID=2321133 RepID=UPI0029F4FE9F|nr:hypothetical protein [Halarcobacter sp.]